MAKKAKMVKEPTKVVADAFEIANTKYAECAKAWQAVVECRRSGDAQACHNAQLAYSSAFNAHAEARDVYLSAAHAELAAIRPAV